MPENKGKADLFALLINLALLLTVAAVVLSAYIRLSNVGLGCTDWPGCYAQLSLTQKPSAIPSTPAGAVHRLAATLLGLLVVTITYMAIRRRRTMATGLGVPLLVFILVIFLSVLGYNTPSWQNPAVALGNLTGGMTLAALLFWMSQRHHSGGTVVDNHNIEFRPWVTLGIIIVALQITLGGWASANFASAACPDLFSCQGNWASLSNLIQGLDPTRQIAIDDNGKIIFDDSVATLQMTHRIFAILALLYTGAMAFMATRLHAQLRTTGLTILVLLGIQVALGIIAVLTKLPLLLVTAHNAAALVLLLAVVNLLHLLTPSRSA